MTPDDWTNAARWSEQLRKHAERREREQRADEGFAESERRFRAHNERRREAIASKPEQEPATSSAADRRPSPVAPARTPTRRVARSRRK